MKIFVKCMCMLVYFLGIFWPQNSPVFAIDSLNPVAGEINKKVKSKLITLNGTWKGTFLSTKGNITYILNMSLTNSASGSKKKFKGTFNEATEDNGSVIYLHEGSVTGTIDGKVFKFTLKADTPCSATFKGKFNVTKTVTGDVILGKEMKGSYSGTDCNNDPFKGKGTINWSW